MAISMDTKHFLKSKVDCIWNHIMFHRLERGLFFRYPIVFFFVFFKQPLRIIVIKCKETRAISPLPADTLVGIESLDMTD